LVLLLLLLSSVSVKCHTDLSFFGQSREVRGRHLFPNHFSRTPSFFSVPSKDEYAISRIHIPINGLNDVIADVSMNNFLISSICSYSFRGAPFYVLNYGSGEGTHEMALNLTMDELQEEMKMHTENKVGVNYICYNGATFDVVWHHDKNFVQHFIVEEYPMADIMKNMRNLTREGFYPSTIQPFTQSSSPHALVIWRKGFVRVANSSLISTAPLTEEEHISVWRGEAFTWRNWPFVHSMRMGSIEISALDWEVEAEMRRLEIPAMSVSILYADKLLFQRAYGYADLISDTEARVDHRYRIASVSKTITAMLVTKLVNEGRLSYGDRVFGPQGLLSSLYRGPSNIFLRSITVQNLLEHSSGAWGHFARLEFSKRELSNSQFLYWILANNQPRIPPGRVHVYSNIGYVFLGRVIEAVTGLSYDDYATRALFKPLGIEGARIAERIPLDDEVTYYSQDNASPYLSWSPRRLDSAAGWTLRASDIARIMGELNSHRVTKYRLMVVRGWTRWNYGRGIQIGNDGSIYHVGSMAGSESLAYSRGRLSLGIVSNVRGTKENFVTPWMENVARRLAARFQ
ncbi:hypothetical protein PMAYCL1PPCAC_10970, partial [Pristionchus mayeri]